MLVRALVLALIFRISDTGNSFPLIDLGADVVYKRLVNLILTFLGSWILFQPFKKWHFLILFVAGLFAWILSYSESRAFHPHVLLLILYAYFCESEDQEGRKKLTVSFFSSIFLASVFFKFNYNFLNGSEFLERDGFLVFTRIYPQMSFLDPGQQWYRTLAWFTILVEFSAGLLVWFRPKLVIQVTCVGFLLLSFINPPVLFVFFCFLAFYFQFSNNNYPQILGFFPTWLFVLVMTKTNSGLAGFPWELLAMNALVLILFIYDLRLQNSHDTFKLPWRIKDFLPAFIVVLTVIAKVAGFPGPLGYSMFSGQLLADKSYYLRTSDIRVCGHIFNGIKSSLNQGIELKWGADGGCRLRYPTESGLRYIKRSICRRFSNAAWNNSSYPHQSSIENCQGYVD